MVASVLVNFPLELSLSAWLPHTDTLRSLLASSFLLALTRHEHWALVHCWWQ